MLSFSVNFSSSHYSVREASFSSSYRFLRQLKAVDFTTPSLSCGDDMEK